MSFLSFLLGEKKKTATVAKERLQIILAHERSGLSGTKRPDYLPDLQRELMAVISKYVSINPEDIKVHLERQDDLEVLDIKIELPESVPAPARWARRSPTPSTPCPRPTSRQPSAPPRRRCVPQRRGSGPPRSPRRSRSSP